ncbi:eukaryotic translation initiation factor 2-alpha kinase eif2-alpha kinase -related [Anaeramoeba ignava]|uniref:non-specific serine/threonine protein kinase n=1 Tax=Anaeramoeba ignava TaxID=1746090 RepID=A0A9Q0R9S4_ANAIG|nr:eukaryotic translation initiation factor 2-alpha kinase eif2-alpha kinase -related [Anaeramoeba ignava]
MLQKKEQFFDDKQDSLPLVLFKPSPIYPKSNNQIKYHSFENLREKSWYEKSFNEIQPIGSGAFGKVFIARHKIDQNYYAIKKIPLVLSHLYESLKEVRCLANLRHQNIVRYYNAWIDVGNYPIKPNEDIHSVSSELIRKPLKSQVYQEFQPLTNQNVNWPEIDEFNINNKSFGVKNNSITDNNVINYFPQVTEDVPKITEDFFGKKELNLKLKKRNLTESESESESESKYLNLKSKKRNLIDSDSNSDSNSYSDSDSNSYSYSDSDSSQIENFSINSKKKYQIANLSDIFSSTELEKNMNTTSLTTVSAETMPEFIFPKKKNPEVPNLYLYIQMELCYNETLRTWLNIESRTVKIPEIKNIFTQILQGVLHFHELNIVHRDLKPENIFLSRDQHIKIGDFGISEFISPKDKIYSKNNKVYGTLIYASPEQLDPQKPIDQKSDIYSLGIILFELLYPFYTQMERIKMITQLREKQELPKEFYEKYPEFSELILQMVSLDPQKRPTCKQLLNNPLFKSKEDLLLLSQKLLKKKDKIKKLKEQILHLKSKI